MSGGHFCYKDEDLKRELFGDFLNCRNTNDYSEERYGNPLNDVRLSELVYDVLSLLHDYDWYMSGDTCKETYNKSKRNFVKKWNLDGQMREQSKRAVCKTVR